MVPDDEPRFSSEARLAVEHVVERLGGPPLRLRRLENRPISRDADFRLGAGFGLLLLGHLARPLPGPSPAWRTQGLDVGERGTRIRAVRGTMILDSHVQVACPTHSVDLQFRVRVMRGGEAAVARQAGVEECSEGRLAPAVNNNQ